MISKRFSTTKHWIISIIGQKVTQLLNKGPIFAYLGAEEPIDQDIPDIDFLTDNAPSFKALIVFIDRGYVLKGVMN
ncbi:hypothetical protein F8388_026323 [Cannabis sativa]|uniref:Uncharacterized protein n=1 Tax=Cannabis sativa TaxID=3483 RepID=A0A7J6DUC4_CANSA|nr:hypothetical protein F8388_026318 [Cannabis sativa]KAF4349174.1 hypothetical protein F8388_026323 [Cannabis sativa]KAF4368112.1 hypothetical protein G4B88_001016 [Cannabis sativa]